MRMLRERDVKQLTAISRVTRWRMIRAGKFPKPVKLSARCVGWIESEVQEWLQQRAAARR